MSLTDTLFFACVPFCEWTAAMGNTLNTKTIYKIFLNSVQKHRKEIVFFKFISIQVKIILNDPLTLTTKNIKISNIPCI